MYRGSLHEPDVCASELWDDHWKKTASLSREKQLMLAVLKSALASYQKYAFSKSAYGLESYRDAADWVDSNDEAWFFSFRCICEHLDISPDHVRRSLALWRSRVEADTPRRNEPLPAHPGEEPEQTLPLAVHASAHR